MFEGFTLERIGVGDVTLRVRHGGAGSPVVLLHGHPRTHATWARVAPLLASGHTVVCPDLRGYGESTLPPDEPGHAQSSKRAMAADVAALMSELGHDRFAVVGHDRGAMVAFRAALDFPRRVARLVVMDSVPLYEVLERADWRFARDWWHWWFLGQTAKPAERVICADPDAWYRVNGPEVMGEEPHADLWRALRNPDVVHGMCEDYRAGLTVDAEDAHDDHVRGRRVACPVLFTYSTRDDMEEIYGDPVAVWEPWTAGSLEGVPIESGHHQSEEAPEQLTDVLRGFLGRG
jgi:haloacetate dehalogenase